ncbi:MAG: glycosyltransferase family 39 protein [Taibaiella sp.]|nr:glycosyltransferase family 39 protein [Taibaiella sp.]
MNDKMPKIPFWIFVIIGLLYFTSVRLDTMDVDASQYAEISREMMKSGDYLHLYDRGIDYLDKPPLLFWLSATSMRIFGVNNFGYKLPSILLALWAIWATYKLAKRLYDENTGRMAALVFASCQGMFLWTNDIRCDTVLMSCTITAIWLIQEWVVSRKLAYLIGGSAAIALGMMTKGPIAAMVPVFCFGTDWVLKRQWRNFFRLEYILALVVIGVLLIPMSIGLYQQFDMHPEKIVNGTKGLSGLRFFYWSQSFGRITGESPWSNGAKMDFLLLNMLWAFLPWIFLFITALIINVITVAKQKLRLNESQEWVTTGGFVLTYLALGSSAYQLPHYIFVAFPLAAIMTAVLIRDMLAGKYGGIYKVMLPAHKVITFLLLGAVAALVGYVFDGGVLVLTLWAIGLAFWLYLLFNKKLTGKLLMLPAIGIIIVNAFLTNVFYYHLMQYQVGSQVGRYIKTSGIPTKDVVVYRLEDPINSIQFYADGTIAGVDTTAYIREHKYLLTMPKHLDALKSSGISYSIIKQGVFYKVSELTPEFLNPKARDKAVKEYCLLKIN